MSRSLDQFQQQRDVALRDAAGKLPAGDRDALLVQAITQRYSKDKPLEKVTDLNGNATQLLDLPAGFEDGFSIIRSIEYPVGNVPPQLLLEESWRMYRTPAKLQIMLTTSAPAASETLRVSWTARHADDGSTVADADFNAVCDFAAALCYEALAGIYAQTGDASIAADSVNYRTKSQEYLGLAKAAAKRYYDQLGISPSEAEASTGPAIATGSVHEALAVGFDRLTHPRSSR